MHRAARSFGRGGAAATPRRAGEGAGDAALLRARRHPGTGRAGGAALRLPAGLEVEWLVAGVRFYHQGSANLVDEAVRERGVDVFLAGVAGRGFTERYWRRILPLLEPRAVVPTHYDDFFRPLGENLEFVANVRLSGLPEEIGAVSRDIEVAALPRSDRNAPPPSGAR